MSNLEEEVKEFEDWMYSQYAPSTVIETVRKFNYVLRRTGSYSREDLMEFLRQLRRDHATNQLVNEYVKIVNRFLEYTAKEKIEYLHESKRSYRKKGYDADQVHKLLEKTDVDTVEWKRNRAMVYLALTTGLRREEICSLKVSDIHGDYLTVLGKGSKVRDVFFPIDSQKVVSSYLANKNVKDSPYVFTTKVGKITNAYMGSIAFDISRQTGVQFSWHRARHTYAKSMVRSGVDLESLRLMLGHERLDTTQIYALKDQQEALEEVRKVMPHFFEGRVLNPPTLNLSRWTGGDLNPGPPPCQGGDLPLIYQPPSLTSQRY